MKIELNELVGLLTKARQVIDGYHADGTGWTEWDEKVRSELSDFQQRLEKGDVLNLEAAVESGKQWELDCREIARAFGIDMESAGDGYLLEIIDKVHDLLKQQGHAETEQHLREMAERDYRELLAFLRGQPPEVYSLHVKNAAQEFQKKMDEANAKIAEMRNVLLEVEWRGDGDPVIARDHFFCPLCIGHAADSSQIPHEPHCWLKHALSTDCGKGYHADEEWRSVVEALSNCLEHVKVLLDIDGRPMDMNDRDIISQAEQAIAHAERLMKEGK